MPLCGCKRYAEEREWGREQGGRWSGTHFFIDTNVQSNPFAVPSIYTFLFSSAANPTSAKTVLSGGIISTDDKQNAEPSMEFRVSSAALPKTASWLSIGKEHRTGVRGVCVQECTL